MKKRFIWMSIIVLVGIALFNLTKMVVFHISQPSISPFSIQEHHLSVYSFQSGGHGQFGESSRHMMRGAHRVEMGSGVQHHLILPFLFNLGLVVFGLALYKLAAKKAIVKGIGVVLLGFGLLALLPNWLVLVAFIGGGYYWYKTKKSKETLGETTVDTIMVPSPKYDFLDEWERTIKKEER